MKDIKILCLDDEPGVLSTLQQIFSEYSLFIESNPLKAIEKIKQEKYDVLLIDYKMQETDGIEFLEQVKKIYSHGDYIALLCTAYGTTHLFTEAREKNLFSYYLEKPFDVPTIKTTVTKAIIELLTKRTKDKDK